MATEAQVLSKYSAEWVQARADGMKTTFQDRNSLMDDMELLYLLDVWQGEKGDDERRVVLPRPMMVVDAMRALLFTRRPILEVPTSTVSKVSEESADRVEKYLYGAWDVLRMYHVLDLTEWYAVCLGLGVIRVIYDPQTPRGELPLVAQALDPRNVFYERDPRRPLEDREVAHWLQMTRREVLNEWGDYPDMDAGNEQDAKWLDAKVDYIDYWASDVIETDEAEEEEEEEGPLGVLGRAMEAVTAFLRPGGEAEEDEGREGDATRNKRRKRVVVNGVMVDGEWLKEPAIVPGYERMPFYRWGGITTPLRGAGEALSVLYPIAGGARTGGSQGLIATENELVGMQLRIVEQHAAAAAITNDDALANLDATPGAINVASRQDFRLDWLVPPRVGPDIGAFLGQLSQSAEQATLPAALMGQYQAAVSGVALQMLTSPVLTRIAARQREREEVLQELNKGILALTEQYAPSRGWTVWGRDAKGVEHEARLAPDEIAGYRRNRVHLSARLPKDAPSEILALGTLVDRKILSRRTSIERVQQILDLAGQSPSDEMRQILVEELLIGQDATRQAMAQRVLQEYDAELAAMAMEAQQPPPQAMPPGPGPGPGAMPMPGQGPMMGMPPNAVPPQAVPEAVGAQNLQAMLNMQGPQGPIPQGPMPPGGVPPGAPR